jgi:hypothetical protein
MSRSDISLPQPRSFGQTTRRDRWWLEPLLVFLGFSAFIVYMTWAAFQNEHFYFDADGAHYLSPAYSPLLWEIPGNASGHAWFGPLPAWWPKWLPFFPAFLILWAPGGFRFTCYYYRGAYYKAFWLDPPSCAVGEPRKSFRGEQSFPLILQNVHRYFLYAALVVLAILAWDAIKSFTFASDDGLHFGVGVGSLIMTANVVLLGGYSLGCHSLRHLIGGGIDRISGRPLRKRGYDCVSCLNRRHMAWAWVSLFWVGFTDLYVRMCSMGWITDLHWVAGG